MGIVMVATFFLVVLPMRAVFSLFQWVNRGLGVSRLHPGRWRRLSEQRRKFWIYVTFGLACVFAVQWLSPRLGLMNTMTEGLGFDLLNKLEYSEIAQKLFGVHVHRQGQQQELAYVALLADDKTQAAWRNPSKVPRQKLLSVIDAAVAYRPKLLIIDLDLSFDPDDPDTPALIAYLNDYAENSSIPLILMRSHRFRQRGTVQIRRQIATPFDDVYPAGAVWWASPQVAESSDKIVRNFVLATVVCSQGIDGNLEPHLVPGVTLMADLLLRSQKNEWLDLRLALAQAVNLNEGDCVKGSYAWQDDASGQPRKLAFKGRQWSFEALRNDNRIVFSITPGKERPEKLGTSISISDLLNGAPIERSLLKDRVVIIGSRHRSSGDIHRTSVGDMPGYVLILNAIETLHKFGQIRSLGIWSFVISTFLAVLIFSWIASRYSALAGMIIATLVVLILLPFSLWLYPKGVWFNFGVPLIAIQGNQVVGEITQAWMSRRRTRNE